MKKSIKLITAPTGFQPGGYIASAYADRARPLTARVDVDITVQDGFRFVLNWRCDEAVIDASDNPRQFIDSCALLAPGTADAPWITMGAPGNPVAGMLWRADQHALIAINAEGLGSVQRRAAPAGWTVEASWADRHWRVAFTVPQWPELEAQKQFAVAVWQGALAERAGLKSVSEGWVSL